MDNKVKLYLKIAQRIVLCVGAVILNACSFDETPADIHQKLVPQIARELIERQHSDQVKGLTPKAEEILKEHADTGMTFEVGAPQMSSETGIRFYSKYGHSLVLIIGLDLNASQNGYIVSGVSVIPQPR